MKKIFIIALLFFAFSNTKAQTKSVPKKDTVDKVEIDSFKTTASTTHISVYQEASFPGGGTNNLFRYIKKNLKYPEDSYQKGVQGIVIVSFFVEKDGSLQDIKVEQSVSPDIDAEALRLIKSSPKWMPAMQDSKLVRESFKVPVTFKIN
jgi:protein TonB